MLRMFAFLLAITAVSADSVQEGPRHSKTMLLAASTGRSRNHNMCSLVSYRS